MVEAEHIRRHALVDIVGAERVMLPQERIELLLRLRAAPPCTVIVSNPMLTSTVPNRSSHDRSTAEKSAPDMQ